MRVCLCACLCVCVFACVRVCQLLEVSIYASLLTCLRLNANPCTSLQAPLQRRMCVHIVPLRLVACPIPELEQPPLHVCVHVCVHACVHACVRVCMCGNVCVRACMPLDACYLVNAANCDMTLGWHTVHSAVKQSALWRGGRQEYVHRHMSGHGCWHVPRHV